MLGCEGWGREGRRAGGPSPSPPTLRMPCTAHALSSHLAHAVYRACRTAHHTAHRTSHHGAPHTGRESAWHDAWRSVQCTVYLRVLPRRLRRLRRACADLVPRVDLPRLPHRRHRRAPSAARRLPRAVRLRESGVGGRSSLGGGRPLGRRRQPGLTAAPQPSDWLGALWGLSHPATRRGCSPRPWGQESLS